MANPHKIHYMKDGQILCSCPSTAPSTTRRKEVTCKNCLKYLKKGGVKKPKKQVRCNKAIFGSCSNISCEHYNAHEPIFMSPSGRKCTTAPPCIRLGACCVEV